MRLDVRTVLLLRHPQGRQVLLLRRSASKKLFPNLITGIGGSVELKLGEADELESAVLRELEEETRIKRSQISQPQLRLSSVLSRDDMQIVLFWYTANFLQVPSDLYCSEGELNFYDPRNLPLSDMVPTARAAIPFVLSLPDDDLITYNAVFNLPTLNLIHNRDVGRR
jgi:8-oxo-dGTP pyrophosphatase MutT (NUDIX family)